MFIEDLSIIAQQCHGLVDQFSLGGRVDPDGDEFFEEILKICIENDTVPNYASSGYRFTKVKAELSKRHCGAVAASWYRNDYTYKSIELLKQAGFRTNIHYVLESNTIYEAIDHIKNHSILKVNTIIFSYRNHKVLDTQENGLKLNDPRVIEFFELLTLEHNNRLGVDRLSSQGW